MKNKLIYLLFIFYLGGFSTKIFSGEPPGKVVDVSQLNGSDLKKLKKFTALTEKGNKIWALADGMDGEIEMLKSEFRFGKARKIEKKQERLKLQAAKYFKDGHKGQFKVLSASLRNKVKIGDSNEAREGLMDGTGLFKKARKAWFSAENRISDNNTVELLYGAIAIENEALTLMEKVLNPTAEENKLLAEEAPIGGSFEPAFNPASFAEQKIVPVFQPAPPPVIPAPVALIVPEAGITPKEEQKPEVTKEDPLKVFFSIQILADKTPVSANAISKVYPGSLQVIHVVGDGWHRYMVGRFKTVTEAKQTMTDQNIKGFIVAYNGEIRITVQEAIELAKNN